MCPFSLFIIKQRQVYVDLPLNTCSAPKSIIVNGNLFDEKYSLIPLPFKLL